MQFGHTPHLGSSDRFVRPMVDAVVGTFVSTPSPPLDYYDGLEEASPDPMSERPCILFLAVRPNELRHG